MADETDVTDALVDIVASAIYPLGITHPPANGVHCRIASGWPVSADLEADLAAGISNVTVFAVPSSASDVGQPFMTEDTIYTPAVHGVSAALVGSTVTFCGIPGKAEYATAIIGGTGYTYLAQTGDTAAQVASGLAAALSADFPGTSASGAVLSVATNRDVLVRLGAQATIATRIHRQRQQFRVTIWSPTHEDRTTVAKFVDVALKRQNVIRLADTTQALITYQGSNPSDVHELNGLYRRDLIFNVTYDTLDTYTAYEITNVGFDVDLQTAV